MPKIFYPGETPGRDGVNAPSPANPAIYPIGGRKGRLGLTPGKGGGAPIIVTVNGQSNAEGTGTTTSAVPAEVSAAMSNVYIWRDIATSGGVVMGWAQYQAGVNSNVLTRPGSQQTFGPEAGAALELRARYPNSPIYIISTTQGGSQLGAVSIYGLLSGSPGDWAPATAAKYFATAKSRTAAALAALPASVNVSTALKLDIWMQGEAEAGAGDVPVSQDYGDNLKAFIVAARDPSTGWGLAADLPFIVGRVNDPQPAAVLGRRNVRMGQARAVNETAVAYLVETDDLPLYTGDNIHYTGPGMVTFGKRCAQAYLGAVSRTAPTYGALTATVGEQLGNGSVLYTVAPSNTPSPTVTYALPSGQSQAAGLGITDLGAVYVTDGTQLAYASGASRTFNITYGNGPGYGTQSVTINLTAAGTITDVAGRWAEVDPTLSAYYTVSGGLYSAINDDRGSGNGFTASGTPRPTQVTFPGATNSKGMQFSGAQYMQGPLLSSAVTADVTQDFTWEGVVAFPSSPTAQTAGYLFCLGKSGTVPALALSVNNQTGALKIDYLNAANRAATSVTSATGLIVNGNVHKIRLRKQGQTLQLFVDEVDVTPTIVTAVMGPIMIASEVASSGRLLLGAYFTASPSLRATIGKHYWVFGNPSFPEVAYMDDQLDAWKVG